MDASVWLDTCGDRRRVVVTGPGVQSPAEPGCKRIQIEGVYVVQGITTMVFDIGGAPTMRIRQGRPPDEWLRDVAPGAPAAPPPSLSGLTFFGAAGRGKSRDFAAEMCGAVSGCSAERWTIPAMAGVAWWFTDFVAVEGRYEYLGKAEASGSGDRFRFDSTREGGLFSAAGKAGPRFGRFRPYGRGGVNYHRATLTTRQSVDDVVAGVGGATQTLRGGTQTYQVRTEGWGPVFGGGLEVWISPRFAIFGEGERTALVGEDTRGGEAEIDDAIVSVKAGVAFRLP